MGTVAPSDEKQALDRELDEARVLVEQGQYEAALDALAGISEAAHARHDVGGLNEVRLLAERVSERALGRSDRERADALRHGVADEVDAAASWASELRRAFRRWTLIVVMVWLAASVLLAALVERAWDAKVGEIAPKSRAGLRKVPIPAVLRDYLLEHRMATGRRDGLVFGRTHDPPFDPAVLRARGLRAWKKAELDPITPHEARHTFASLMIAAGVNAKALSTYMGHSSVTITYDRYGHLMPGNEDEAAALLDAYLDRQTSSSGG